MRKHVSDAQQFYPQVFRANLIQLQDVGEALVMNAICGLKQLDVFASLNPDGLWVKMCRGYCQLMLDGSLETYSETWPKRGTMSHGTAFQPMEQVHHFGESELPLWPRPTASDGMAWKKVRRIDVRFSLKKYWTNKHTDRPIYHFMWNGLSTKQAADLCEMMMGFPKGWTDLNA